MNAVSLNAPSQPNPVALPPNMLTQGPTAGGGFIDLISLLIAAPIPEPGQSPDISASPADSVSSNNVVFSQSDGSVSLGITFSQQPPTDASSLGVTTTATPDQIASALIRFMAKGNRSGTPGVTPPTGPAPTGTARKGSSVPKTAATSKTAAALGFPSNYLNPAGLNSSNVIAVTVPQPAVVSLVVSVDPQFAQGTASISSESAATPALPNRPVLNRSVPAALTISSSDSDASSNPSSPGQLLANQTPGQPSPAPFFPNLNTADASPAAKAPVTFRMQLTPVASQAPVDSQKISDPQATADPRSPIVPKGSQPSLATPVCPQEEPAKPNTPTPDPAQPPSNTISSTASLGIASVAAISPVVFKDSASNAEQNPENTEGALSGAPKPVNGGNVSAPTNPGSQTKTGSAKTGGEDKSGAETKPGSEQDTSDHAPEKTPLAAALPAPSSSQIPGAPFTSLHTPAPTQPAPLHAAAAASKTMEPAATPLPAANIKDGIAEPQPSRGQTQQIDVRITPPQAPAVDLQVSQRSGQIQVVVRTQDPGLETALRQDLGTLVHSLERSGFQAETFIPSAPESSRMNSQPDPRHNQPDSSGNGSFAQGGGQNQGRNSGRGSGGNSRGNASRDSQQFEAWTNPQEQQP